MTRVLSELLGATGPEFRAGLHKLEQASGHNGTDIRLSTDIQHAVHSKLRELGLDQRDTTGEELYEALRARIAADDERLFAHLREKYAEPDDIACVARELSTVPIPKSSFALKSTVAKQMIKKHAPKKAMKLLGYRSLDSLLKHEPVAAIYAACAVTESLAWHKQLAEQYKKLRASDFEIRPMSVIHPSSERWQQLADSVVARNRHNVVSFKELATVVLLPLPAEKPPAAALTSLLLALHDMNEIRAASTYLKLCQVKPNFGTLVQGIVSDEPVLTSHMFNRPVSWQIIQRYYGRFTNRFRAELFEPHIQPEDLTWHSIEKVLAYIDPSLEFWRHTTHLSLLSDHQPVSLNIIDAAINYCNNLPFENRLSKYVRQLLWHELIIRYLKHENVEQTVLQSLETELAPVAATD